LVHLATGSATTDQSGDSASNNLMNVDFPVAETQRLIIEIMFKTKSSQDKTCWLFTNCYEKKKS